MLLIAMRPSLVRPPCALKKVIVGVAARPLVSTVTPGMTFSSDPYARVAGSDAIASALITVSRRVFCTSTTGEALTTVTVSSRAPTVISIGMVRVSVPVRTRPSRLMVAKPGNDTVIVYVPGRRSTMRYKPALSVTALRTFSMSTSLDASTVTPGRTAPDVSLTVPVIAPWANTTVGAKIVHTNTTAIVTRARMSDPPTGLLGAKQKFRTSNSVTGVLKERHVSVKDSSYRIDGISRVSMKSDPIIFAPHQSDHLAVGLPNLAWSTGTFGSTFVNFTV